MIRCKRCNTECINNTNFCPNCGYSFSKERELTTTLILGVIASVILLYFAILFAHFMYEQRNSVPLNLSATIGDAKVDIVTIFSKEDNLIGLQLFTDEVIEDWQLKKINKKEIIPKITIENYEKSSSFMCDPLSLSINEKLYMICSINNASLKDYVELKEKLPTANMEVSLPPTLSFTKSIRQKDKKAYLAEQERLRIQRERQAALERERERRREMFMNTLFNPYYYY